MGVTFVSNIRILQTIFVTDCLKKIERMVLLLRREFQILFLTVFYNFGAFLSFYMVRIIFITFNVEKKQFSSIENIRFLKNPFSQSKFVIMTRKLPTDLERHIFLMIILMRPKLEFELPPEIGKM